MSDEDIFLAVERSSGDFAGVLERGDQSVYFYLYEIGKGILGSINVTTQIMSITDSSFKIEWNSSETKVGLFIENKLAAMFNLAAGAKTFESFAQTDVLTDVLFS